MKVIKKIVASAVAAVSFAAIGATASAVCVGVMGVTASAEAVQELPVSWMAIYQIGSPTSVNKQYSYTVNGSSTGYKIECVFFNGGDDSVLLVTTSNGESYKLTKESYKETIYVSGGTVTITFRLLGTSANFCARGTIDYA